MISKAYKYDKWDDHFYDLFDYLKEKAPDILRKAIRKSKKHSGALLFLKNFDLLS